MKAITILARCRNADSEIRRIQQRIRQRREAAESVTPKMDAIGGGRGTSEPDKIAAFVAAIVELEQRLEAREQARRVEVVAACVLLEALPENESAVLHQYYIQRQKVPGIAHKLGYTEGYIRKLKSEAERMLDEVPESRVAGLLPAWYIREQERPVQG